MRIDSSGNVGVGDSSPSTRLQVRKDGITGANNFVSLLTSSDSGKGVWQGIDVTNRLFYWKKNDSDDYAYDFQTANGTSRLRIDSSGNVGIGTTSPSARLFVSSGSAAQYGGFNSNATNGGYLTFESSGVVHGDIGTAAQVVSGGSSSDFGINARGARNLILGTNNSERLRIDSSGRVGIGTTSPQKELQINATEPTIRLEESGAGSKRLELSVNSAAEAKIFANQSGGNLILGTSGTERLRIDSSGNVGVGTASPSYRLHINSGANQPALFESSAIVSVAYFKDAATSATPYCGSSGNSFYIGTNSVERLRIDSSGNCSIGTATGLSTLHVHGNVTLSNTTTATSAGTGGLSKPATYAGYLTVSINGTSRKIPYYAT